MKLKPGQKLRGLLENAGLTQQEFADAMGRGQATISSWITGARNMRLTAGEWLAMAETLSINPATLLEELRERKND